jgi:hypothetical protein
MDKQKEHDIPFADVLAKSILDDYQNLKPWIKEGIVHRIGQYNEPSKVASRYLEVKYRIHDELYPEVDEMGHHNIDEDGIAKTLLPYIKSYMKSIQEYIRHQTFKIAKNGIHRRIKRKEG